MRHDTMPETWACCAYLRKSREDIDRDRDADIDTLAKHRAIVEKMAKRNGHRISKWFCEVVSGETISGRPEVQNMLHEIAYGTWDAVYAVEAARLGRGGGSDQEKIVNAFKYTNTVLITCDKIYDPGSKSDMTQLKRDLRNSEDELDSIRARLMRGKVRAVEDGKWIATGRTPFGWKAVRIKGEWQLRPDERHNDMLRMYDLAEAGKSPFQIAVIFNSEGVKTARGGYRWTASAVKAILLNPANAGMVRFGLNKTLREFDPDTFEVKKRKKVNENPLIERGLHYGTGGIDYERFKRIERMMVEKSRTVKGREQKNPLAGILVCGKCGYAMNYHMMSSGKSAAYFYAHKVKRFMTRPCDGVRGARADLVMDVLTDALKRVCEDIEIQLSGGDGMAEHERHLAALRASIEREDAARSRIMDAFEAGAYTVDEFKDRKAAVEERIERLESELASAKPPEYTPETVTSLRSVIDLLNDDTVNPVEKNTFIKRVIKRIDYFNDTPPYVLPNIIRLEIHLR